MQTTPSFTKITTLVIFAATAALSQTSTWAQPVPAHQHAPGMAMPASGKASMDMKTSMQGMNDQMVSMAMTGDPDIDFAAMMRIHHLGAVDMAQEELRTGRNPQMRKLAEDIIAAQKHEIAVFEKYLASKGHPVDKAKK